MCTMDELMPSIGNPMPSPSILAVVICQSDSTVQNVGKLYSDPPHSPCSDTEFDSPFGFSDETLFVSKTHLISISDDGKIWNWLLTAEEPKESQKNAVNLGTVSSGSEIPISKANDSDVSASEEPSNKATDQSENAIINKTCKSKRSSMSMDMAFKVGDYCSVVVVDFICLPPK